MRFTAILLLVAFVFCLPTACADSKSVTPVERFAQCLTEKKAVMYGAFWCTHCDDQKKLFGDAWKHVTYVECAVKGTRQRTEECTRLNIVRTPTWIFANGERKEGMLTFEELSRRTGCKLP